MLRRLTLVLVLLLAPFPTLAGTDVPRLLVLGDSLSAAYGLPSEQGWVALLARYLEQSERHYEVINASITGETTQGGLLRLPQLLDTHQPAIVIIELGANDGLRGFPIPVISDNLLKMVSLAKQSDARIVLVGMHIPPNYGSKYTAMFHENFQRIAEQEDIPLVPFFLEGVATVEGMMQADGLHPTAAAQTRMLQNVLPALSPLLADAGATDAAQ